MLGAGLVAARRSGDDPQNKGAPASSGRRGSGGGAGGDADYGTDDVDPALLVSVGDRACLSEDEASLCAGVPQNWWQGGIIYQVRRRRRRRRSSKEEAGVVSAMAHRLLLHYCLGDTLQTAMRMRHARQHAAALHQHKAFFCSRRLLFCDADLPAQLSGLKRRRRR